MKKSIKVLIILVVCVLLIVLGVSLLKNNSKENTGSTEIKPPLEGEAVELVKEKYAKTIDLMLNLSEFEFVNDIDDENAVMEEDSDMTTYYYLITNYEEIVNKYFTQNMREYFEENAIFLEFKDGKPYRLDGGFGVLPYDGIESVEEINITETRIDCVIKIKINDLDGTFKEYRITDFALVRQNDNWLVDKFEMDKLF